MVDWHPYRGDVPRPPDPEKESLRDRVLREKREEEAVLRPLRDKLVGARLVLEESLTVVARSASHRAARRLAEALVDVQRVEQEVSSKLAMVLHDIETWSK